MGCARFTIEFFETEIVGMVLLYWNDSLRDLTTLSDANAPLLWGKAVARVAGGYVVARRNVMVLSLITLPRRNGLPRERMTAAMKRDIM